MGNKIKNFFKKIFKSKSGKLVLSSLILFIFVKNYFKWGIFSFLPNDIHYFTYTLLVYIFSSFLALLFILFISIMQKYMYKILNKNKKDYNQQLFTWLGEDSISNKFIDGLFSAKASKSYDDIENLNKIKQALNVKLKDSLLDYKLLKNHLEYKTKKDFDSKAGTILMTVIGTILTTQFIPKLVLSFSKAESNDLLLKQITNLFGLEGFYSLFLYGSIFILIYLPVKSMLLFVTEDKRRLEYIISILDIIIKEKEKSSTSSLEDNNE